MLTGSRRGFLHGLALAGTATVTAGAAISSVPVRAAGKLHMFDDSPQTQPPLPYAIDALAPTISARTVDVHYHRHHQGYYATLAKLVNGTGFENSSLEELMTWSAHRPDRAAVFNAAAQAWNHNLYWQSLAAEPVDPAPALAAAIAAQFGSKQALIAELGRTATAEFGSGWGWLVVADDGLRVIATSNANNPLVDGMVPLLVVDVWEHAYYLDYENQRTTHIEIVLARLLDWRNASMRYARATGRHEA